MMITSGNFKTNHHFVQLSDDEFTLITKLLYDECGLNISSDKKSLVKGRLNSFLNEMGFTSYFQLCNAVRNDASRKILGVLIHKLTTHHTFFFREKKSLDFFKETIMPEFYNAKRESEERQLRIWSAGCSSGEEPYTLSMLLCEFFRLEMNRWDLNILATDVSLPSLKKALEGKYDMEQMKNVPPVFLKRYFKFKHNNYLVSERIREHILFKHFNLNRSFYPFKHRFHTIFCRNVLIYFDRKKVSEIVKQFAHFLCKGGYLILGGSETLGRSDSDFKFIRPAVYQRC